MTTRETTRACCLLGLLLVMGCGSGAGSNGVEKNPSTGNPDDLHRQRIDLWHELAAALEADKPEAEIKSLQTRLETANKQLRAMAQTLSVEESGRLLNKFGTAVVKAKHRYKEALKAAEDRRK